MQTSLFNKYPILNSPLLVVGAQRLASAAKSLHEGYIQPQTKKAAAFITKHSAAFKIASLVTAAGLAAQQTYTYYSSTPINNRPIAQRLIKDVTPQASYIELALFSAPLCIATLTASSFATSHKAKLTYLSAALVFPILILIDPLNQSSWFKEMN